MRPVVALLSILLLGLGAHAEDAKAPEKLVVALKPDKNPDQILKEKQALQEFLSKELGMPVEVVVPLSSAVILEGYANGTIDLGYLSGTDMHKARAAKSAELALVGEINGKTHYNSYWLALKDKPYKSIEELKGKPVAFASKTSTSGFTIPHWNLIKSGLVKEGAKLEEFFGEGNVFFGTGYVSAVERVLKGDAEAAAVSDYVFDKDKHLTAEQRAQLKVVQQQGPVPTHILAVRTTLPKDLKDKLKAALLKLNEEANHALRDKVFTSKLVEADTEKHLASLTEALKLTGQAK
ncbi:MAG TPA: phosphate/phosphite/phosphonate ABC transporter substrate-binding protein [Planctomycetota bacterium]|nr:phosphate/phosphite/phosphonate ABC transporter substrate-binding protein [Planctomycetota bacterium]